MIQRLLPLALALMLPACMATTTAAPPREAAAAVVAPAESLPPVAPRPPRFRLTTADAFEVSSVPVYGGQHAEIYAHIDRHLAAHTAALQRWVKQPSISTQNRGVIEMANMLRKDLLALGFKEAELAPTDGHPGVFGFYDAGAAKTLVVYMMYDVQPVEENWRVTPFDGAIVDHEHGRALMARGATNQKGPERAFLNALESIRAVRGTLPVNIMVVAEGEEELGSPHYPQVISRYESRLRAANGVLFPTNAQNSSGDVTMSLGVKGIIYLELEAKGSERGGGPMTAEVHGSFKALTDAPAWRLVQALATLTTPDGNTILVPGYYDAIRAPNTEEEKLLNAMLRTWSEREGQLRTALGIGRWIEGMSGEESLLRYQTMSTLNIDGLVSGYTGEGVKTILPHRAVAKVDSRLVPNQTPQEALRLIREHLDRNGFTDIEIRLLAGYPPAQTSVSTPLVQAAIGVYAKYGLPPSIAPRTGGSAPYYVFTDRLKLPLVSAGIGYGSGAHAPNEFMILEPKAGSRIAGLAEIEKFYVDLLFALAEAR
jgi:acetylornithine deacetylase/succinyl-diaminopimelate desuccinylase-like protein